MPHMLYGVVALSRRTRNRIRRITAILLIAAALLYVLVRARFAPIVKDLAKTRVDNDASSMINEAISEAVESGEINYDSLVDLDKDAEGNITAMKTNMAEVNRLKGKILATINEKILDISTEDLSIPLGSVIVPELFSGHGPKIPVRILAIRSSNADFESRFFEAGINQTTQQIVMVISVNITVLTPAGTQKVTVRTDAVVAETVIVGDVPTTYVDVG